MGGSHASASLADDVGQQVRRRWLLVLVVVAVGAAIAGLVAVLGHHEGRDLADLSRDPAAVAELPVYIGAIAYLAFVGWATAFGAGAAGVLVARRLDLAPRARMLLVGAALSLWLLLDDMFEFHESVLPRLGVPEKVTYLAYVVALVAWLWFCRDSIRESDWLVLVLALGLLTASAALDEVFHGSNVHAYVEDVFKMVGTWLWGAYFVLTAARDLPVVSLSAPMAEPSREDLSARRS